ncbi:MAG: UDP-glucuronosyltransferase [Bacteroidetes bacterium]|nr:MAG: UDP-glucuronosyltransferase [Bacteroidota bacterium]
MNILYGVPGEGMGHATRSKVVIAHLLKNHDVQVVSSSRAYQFLYQAFGNRVHEIKGLHFAYKNAQISKLGTLLLNLKHAPSNALQNFSQYLLLDKQFKPDVIISDFESFTHFFAKFNRIPLISIDNMQVINRCKLDVTIPAEERNQFRLAKSIVQAKVPGAEHYYITSFFNAATSKENTSIVPPIIRDAIINVKPRAGNHVLMYQTSSTLINVKKILKQLPHISFIVYGMNRDEQDENICFKPFSEEGFIQDFASAKAVIANGGFSFISEAVYLHKPVYAFPIVGQFEQWMNAAYIEKLGYGRHFTTLEADSLKAFLFDLPHFQHHLNQYQQSGNELLFKELDSKLSSL